MKQNGFTLFELLVSLTIFGIFTLGMSASVNQLFRTVGTESRGVQLATELRHALNILSSELRMSTSISPYYPGVTTATSSCAATLQVTATSIKFMVVHDADVSSNGVNAYYVGYSFNAATGELLRGQVPAVSVTTCTVPAQDPTSSTYASTIAKNVVQIDADSNGSLDPVFAASGNGLLIRLGVEADSNDHREVRQELTLELARRAV